MKQLSPPAHTAGPAKPPEPSGDTGRRRTRHQASRAGRAGPPGTGVGSPCRPGVSRAREPRDGPRGAAAVLSHGPDSAKPRRITPPRAAASPAEVIMVPPGCPRRGGPRGPKGPGGSGRVRSDPTAVPPPPLPGPEVLPKASSGGSALRPGKVPVRSPARDGGETGRRDVGSPGAGGLVPPAAPHGHPGTPTGLSGLPRSPRRLLTASRAQKHRNTAGASGAGALSSPRVSPVGSPRVSPPVPACVPCPQKRLLSLPGQAACGVGASSGARGVRGSARVSDFIPWV